MTQTVSGMGETLAPVEPVLCDKCGGQTQARVMITLPTAGKLAFCQHDFSAVADNLPRGTTFEMI